MQTRTCQICGDDLQDKDSKECSWCEKNEGIFKDESICEGMDEIIFEDEHIVLFYDIDKRIQVFYRENKEASPLHDGDILEVEGDYFVSVHGILYDSMDYPELMDLKYKPLRRITRAHFKGDSRSADAIYEFLACYEGNEPMDAIVDHLMGGGGIVKVTDTETDEFLSYEAITLAPKEDLGHFRNDHQLLLNRDIKATWLLPPR